MSDVLLSVSNLRTWFYTDQGVARAVDGVSFEVRAGETLGIVGESGCGKTVTSLSVLRLLPEPPARIESGSSIMFRGEELLDVSEDRMRALRGNDVAMIFQEPMSSLNPVYTVGSQISEAIRLHRKMDRNEARTEAVRLLREVGIPDADRRVDQDVGLGLLRRGHGNLPGEPMHGPGRVEADHPPPAELVEQMPELLGRVA